MLLSTRSVSPFVDPLSLHFFFLPFVSLSEVDNWFLSLAVELLFFYIALHIVTDLYMYMPVLDQKMRC